MSTWEGYAPDGRQSLMAHPFSSSQLEAPSVHPYANFSFSPLQPQLLPRLDTCPHTFSRASSGPMCQWVDGSLLSPPRADPSVVGVGVGFDAFQAVQAPTEALARAQAGYSTSPQATEAASAPAQASGPLASASQLGDPCAGSALSGTATANNANVGFGNSSNFNFDLNFNVNLQTTTPSAQPHTRTSNPTASFDQPPYQRPYQPSVPVSYPPYIGPPIPSISAAIIHDHDYHLSQPPNVNLSFVDADFAALANYEFLSPPISSQLRLHERHHQPHAEPLHFPELDPLTYNFRAHNLDALGPDRQAFDADLLSSVPDIFEPRFANSDLQDEAVSDDNEQHQGHLHNTFDLAYEGDISVNDLGEGDSSDEHHSEENLSSQNEDGRQAFGSFPANNMPSAIDGGTRKRSHTVASIDEVAGPSRQKRQQYHGPARLAGRPTAKVRKPSCQPPVVLTDSDNIFTIDDEEDSNKVEMVDMTADDNIPEELQAVPDDRISTKLSKFECIICLDTASTLTVTHCGHMFCGACLHQAMHAEVTKKICPMCRQKLEDRHRNGPLKTSKTFFHLEMKLALTKSQGKQPVRPERRH